MTWNEILAPVLASAKLVELKTFLKNERINKKIFPEGKDVFRAFDLCSFDNTKVVILGQDPYPTEGTADGLAFSSRQDNWPKSLEVIFKEIYTDLNIQYFHNITIEEFFPTSDLSNWTKLGILLLNTTLTVEEGKPGSHKNMGWELLIDTVFEALNKKDHQIIFFLWGKEAQAYKEKIKNPMHIYFEAPHPAAELYHPEGPKFSGCRHFSILRDVLPLLNSSNTNKSLSLDSCFDKVKAKEIIKEHYPIEAEKMCSYIDNELFINVPINKDAYLRELKDIEKHLSTKPF